MILMLLAGLTAEPLVPTARAFTPPPAPVAYRVTQVHRIGTSRLRAALTETIRFEANEGGFRATLVSGEPAVEGPPALLAPLKLALATFARIAVTYQLDRSGHPVSVIDQDRVWDEVLEAIDTQRAATRSRTGQEGTLAPVRAALAAKSPAERETMLLDMADTLLGFVPDALAPGGALPYQADAVGAGTLRRLADEGGAARYAIDTSGGLSPAREHVDVAVDPDGLLRWLRRTVTRPDASEPEQAMLIERLASSGN